MYRKYIFILFLLFSVISCELFKSTKSISVQSDIILAKQKDLDSKLAALQVAVKNVAAKLIQNQHLQDLLNQNAAQVVGCGAAGEFRDEAWFVP